MYSKNQLHEYQHKAIDFIKQKKCCALFLDMGLGKTITTLTALSDMLRSQEIKKVLVIAPLRVANMVWQQEARNWHHTKHLDVKICTGTQRERIKALMQKADIHVINREQVPWIVDYFKADWPYDALVIDESSSFKSPRTLRFKALKKVIDKMSVRIALTGTPSPQSLLDLWSQIFLLDKGKRLSPSFRDFKLRFFIQTGYGGYKLEIFPGAEKVIRRKISDIIMRLDSKDYLQLPEKLNQSVYVTLPDKVKKQYRQLEKQFCLKLEDENFTVVSAAAMAGKLMQMSNGFLYDEEQVPHDFHSMKTDALKEIIEDNPNENILVAYNFRHDLTKLKQAFPSAVFLSRKGSETDDWNAGKTKLLIAHPQSAGHGLNLQAGGRMIVFYSLTWSLEAYQQFCARLHRQGQERPVRIIHLIAKQTIDHVIMKAIESKAKTQEDLLNYLRKEMKDGSKAII